MVSFPSPTIPINFFSQQFNMTLNSFDLPTDNYTWGVGTSVSSWFFIIDDLTDGKIDDGPSFNFGNFGQPYGSGDVNFDLTSAPEPNSARSHLINASGG